VGVAQGAQLGEGLVVFGPVGALLGGDDVLEAGGANGEPLAVEEGGSLGEFFVGDEAAVAGFETGED